MHCSTLFACLVLPGTLAFSSQLAAARTAVTNASLYAYGTNISGSPLLYNLDDGKLYISASDTALASLQTVTWNVPSITTSLSTSATAYLGNGTSPGGLALDLTGANSGEVHVSTNGTSGITLYGKQLVYVSGSNFEAKFWAKQVEMDGASVYLLTWNEDNVSADVTTPVNIKTDAPATVAT
ncbi:hypothetical protein BD289DRAFT_475260 [Coniella lustricola]|uniref:Uncharacterized protein n=1 Tax=Coniella lustricola TaxID=2025994 RepID=A0A2T3A3M2_9PEZI|nr:hypothetical protein BD289DRAFT_475260 [Coniella lustricola]